MIVSLLVVILNNYRTNSTKVKVTCPFGWNFKLQKETIEKACFPGLLRLVTSKGPENDTMAAFAGQTSLSLNWRIILNCQFALSEVLSFILDTES